MDHKKTELFHSRSSNKEFLFYKTDAKPRKGDAEIIFSVDSKRIEKAFPDILVGENLIRKAMIFFEYSEKFDAMIIKIDCLKHGDDAAFTDQEIDLWMGMANIIDALCKYEDGIWGHLEAGRFGCFFPKKDSVSSLEFAKKINNRLTADKNETVSIGIASYPTLNFNKDQIIKNAEKALDHASFFGPGSTVVFDAVSLNISGDILYQDGNIEGAVKEFETALLLDPSNVNVHNSLGVCYGILGDYKKALEEFKQAVRLDPDEIMSLYNLGLVHMLTGDKDKALKCFLDAGEKDENIFEVALQTGKVYMEMGQLDIAKEFLEKAVKLQPEAGQVYRYLGECYTALNITDEAIAAYKKAIRQNPNDAESLSALGYLFDLLGENPEITTIFCQQSIDIVPENGLFRQRLGSLYLKRDRLEEALEQFQKAHDLGHDSQDMIAKIKKLMQK